MGDWGQLIMMFNTDEAIELAKKAQKKYTDTLMKNKHVMGVSVAPVDGYSQSKPTEYALVLLVDEDGQRHWFPTKLDDVPVIVQPINRVTKQ